MVGKVAYVFGMREADGESGGKEGSVLGARVLVRVPVVADVRALAHPPHLLVYRGMHREQQWLHPCDNMALYQTYSRLV